VNIATGIIDYFLKCCMGCPRLKTMTTENIKQENIIAIFFKITHRAELQALPTKGEWCEVVRTEHYRSKESNAPVKPRLPIESTGEPPASTGCWARALFRSTDVEHNLKSAFFLPFTWEVAESERVSARCCGPSPPQPID
jgi:hypothetical protein